MNSVKKWQKSILTKKLIISEEKEKQFQSGNTCWICEIIENDSEKVRDPCHITGKFRGADHWSCNKNLQLTKKFIF